MLEHELDPGLLRVFLSATVAICAMILPGVSGAFLLEVLGIYRPTTEALHGSMNMEAAALVYVLVFIAGAAIGLRATNFDHPMIKKIAEFAGKCGVAFQLQDDILGVIGDEEKLGKPVGSDLREGKRTVILLHSLEQMTPAERAFTLRVIGNEHATNDDIRKVTDLLRSTGGIEHTKQLAESYITEAMDFLDELEDTPYKELLSMWARYIVARNF